MDLLIVEDEEGIREGLAAFLRLRGHGVVTAADVAAGVAALAEGHFDAVVTDWQLGGGTDARPILAALDGAPCIVASGYGDDVVGHGGVVAVLDKPVRPQRLLAELEELAARCDPVEPTVEVARPGGDAALFDVLVTESSTDEH